MQRDRERRKRRLEGGGGGIKRRDENFLCGGVY